MFCGKAIYRGNFFEMINPVTESEAGIKKTGMLLPIYPTTKGLGQTNLRSAAENILNNLSEIPKDILPASVISETGLSTL